jgi:hypothetical protein
MENNNETIKLTLELIKACEEFTAVKNKCKKDVYRFTDLLNEKS